MAGVAGGSRPSPRGPAKTRSATRGPPSSEYQTLLFNFSSLVWAEVGESTINRLGDAGKDYCFFAASGTSINDRDITHEEATSCQTSLRAKIAELGFE